MKLNCNKPWHVKINKSAGLAKIRKLKNMCSLRYVEENSHYSVYEIWRSLDICLPLISEMFKDREISLINLEEAFIIYIW